MHKMHCIKYISIKRERDQVGSNSNNISTHNRSLAIHERFFRHHDSVLSQNIILERMKMLVAQHSVIATQVV